MDERSAKLAFKLVPFIVLLIAGAVMILLASSIVGANGERMFEPYLGTSGVVAVIVGIVGILFIAFLK